MSDGNFKNRERLDDLRQRLYDRGKAPESRQRFKLTDEPTEVPKSWHTPPAASGASRPPHQQKSATVPSTPAPSQHVVAPTHAPAVASVAPTAAPEPVTSEVSTMAPKKRSRSYRVKILLAGIGFFIFAVAASSLFFIFGGNTITGENIVVDINGPSTIGGGEIIPLQIGITNQNSVSIDSATLIVTYPTGTQSATEVGRELFVDRIGLQTISSGETLNVPLRAIIFGEENEEKFISAEVEYRISGSNSTFAKAATEPLRFRIGSSPIALGVETLQKVSSGQEIDVKVKVTSNSPNALNDILIKAEYPSGFDFTSANPAPVAGQNVWLIDTIEPEGSAEITIKGVVVGRESDTYSILFSSGVSSETDPLELSSVFSSATTNFEVENPFIGVGLSINNDSSGTVAVESGDSVRVEVVVTNTIDDTIYDGRVELSLSGNALSDFDVETNGGFYDSANNKVYWDAAEFPSLAEIAPGREVSLRVSLTPDPDIIKTPQLGFDVDVRARRVTERNVTEELIGTATGAVKVSSVASIITETGRNTSVFSDRGPIPPVAESGTTYTMTLFVQNGSNDVSDAEMVMALPGYVSWLEETAGAGTITFNETNRTVTWRIGNIDANQSKISAFQVELLPSISQIGTTPTLVGTQRLRATDSFTGAVVRTEFSAVTTRLSEEAGFNPQDGDVVAP